MEETMQGLLSRNRVDEVTEYDKRQFGFYLDVVKSFAQITYRSLYVIDYEKMVFEYVSNNPLFLSGYTSDEVLEMGYDFYLKTLPQADLELLGEINMAGFDFFDKLPNNEDRKLYSISYDFHLKGKYEKPVLVNQKLTPIFLNEKGMLWKSLCVVSLSHSKTAGNVTINKQGSGLWWKLDMITKTWVSVDKPKLKERELEVLRLYAQGLTITEIADLICVSPDTIKYYRRKIFEAFEVKSFAEALHFAIDNKII
jgi:DNA-binding CsgD family transcriptional regulator